MLSGRSHTKRIRHINLKSFELSSTKNKNGFIRDILEKPGKQASRKSFVKTLVHKGEIRDDDVGIITGYPILNKHRVYGYN